tara:strand:+ start:387 stop:701 length:315 start_codon:yes stop_codon:yes gene_type:complete
MDIIDTRYPVSVEVFFKLKHPNIEQPILDFLIDWRNAVGQGLPFNGWGTITDNDRKKKIVSYAHDYSNYLIEWADDKDEDFLNNEGHRAEQVSDDATHLDAHDS